MGDTAPGTSGSPSPAALLLAQLRASQHRRGVIILGAGASAAMVAAHHKRLVGSWCEFLKACAQQFCKDYGVSGDVTQWLVKEVATAFRMDERNPSLNLQVELRELREKYNFAAGTSGTDAAAGVIEFFAAKFQMSHQDIGKVLLQELAEKVLEELEVDLEAPLAVVLRKLKPKFAMFSLNYDTVPERALDCRSLDYDINVMRPQVYRPEYGLYEAEHLPFPATLEEARDAMVRGRHALAFIEAVRGNAPLHARRIVHLHGLYMERGQLVLSKTEYEKTAQPFCAFMEPLVSERSLIFIGTSGSIFDKHFIRLWRKLAAERIMHKHFMIVSREGARLLRDQIAALTPAEMPPACVEWLRDTVTLVEYDVPPFIRDTDMSAHDALPRFLQDMVANCPSI